MASQLCDTNVLCYNNFADACEVGVLRAAGINPTMSQAQGLAISFKTSFSDSFSNPDKATQSDLKGILPQRCPSPQPMPI